MKLTATYGAMVVLCRFIEKVKTAEGRVRIQKTLYLLKTLGVEELARVRFKYHHYGPYSQAVSGALMEAIAHGLVIENTENFDEEWQRFSYRAGDDLSEMSHLLSDNSARLIDQVVDMTKDAHWRVLEMAATIDFLQRTEDLSGPEARQRALRLKPHGKDYVTKAEAILEHLRAIHS